MFRLLLLTLLFTNVAANAVTRVVRGYVMDNSTDAVIFTSEALQPDAQVSYFLRGFSAGIEKQLKAMQAGEAYEVVLTTTSTSHNLNPAHVIEITKVAFRGAGVAEPSATDPSTIPELHIDDRKLADRAHVYLHYLNDKLWVTQFLGQGGHPLLLKTMRKTVILNTLFTEFPAYPRTQVDEERDLFVDAALELWELGGSQTLRLIQEMIVDRLDPQLPITADETAVPIRQDKLVYPCQMMLHHIEDFKRDGFKIAYNARAKIITHLDNMALKLPTVSIDRVQASSAVRFIKKK